MDAHASYNEGTWTIAAGDEATLPLHAEFLHVVAASQATFRLGLDGDETGAARPGAQFRARPQTTFKNVRVRNSSATEALVVTLGYGRGEFQLQQFRFLSAGSFTTTPDVAVAADAAQEVLPVNLDRRRAVIGNLVGNAREVRLGDSAVGAMRGSELAPGQHLDINGTAAIWVYNPHAGAQRVSLIEEGE